MVPEISNPKYGSGQSDGPLGFLRDAWHQAKDPYNFAETPEGQMPGGAPKEHVLERLELLLPITCNQHPWMKMFVNVVNNPFFAVSDGQGRFAISGLPPGDYTIEAIHEKLGTQSARVTVEPHRAAVAEFTFKPQ